MRAIKEISLILLFCLSAMILHAQKGKSEIDSLLIVAKSTTDTIRFEALLELSELYESINVDSALLFGELLLSEAKSVGNLSYVGDAYNIIAYSKREKEYFEEAFGYFDKALAIRKDLKEHNKASNTLNLIGTVHHKIGDLEKSLEYYMLAIEKAEILNNPKYLSSPISNIGKLYSDMGDYERAKEYDVQALQIARSSDIQEDIALAYNNLGTIYQETGHLDTAKLFYKEAMRIYTEVGNYSGGAHVFNNMAIIYFMEENYTESLDYFRKAKEMRFADNDMVNYSQSLMNLGIYYQMMEVYDSAIYYASASVEIAIEYHALLEQKDSYLVLAECYQSIGKFEKALKSYQDFVLIKDSIMDVSGLKNIQEMEMKYKSKEQKKELELLDLKIKQEAEEKQYAESRKSFQFLIIGIAGAGMLFILLLIGRGYMIKRKSNIKLADINGELESQKSIIEEKNKDITDSILYAQKIQEAMLHSGTDIKSVFPDSFVLYLPKDIVAGDFYWWVKDKNRCYLAAADCTGHGVPGAMVSVACANILNRSVKELGITKPSEILDKTTDLVIEAFSSNSSGDEYIKDGMDISLCSFDLQEIGNDNMRLEYSGANNPLWIFRKNGTFEELAANRQPIGYFDYRKEFTNHSVELEKGDTIYLFSDGYMDQFGGKKNKKYKSSNFKKRLLAIQDSSLSEQANMLQDEFDIWKGEFEQTDDVCVIGVRI